jgi:hypothetical protein
VPTVSSSEMSLTTPTTSVAITKNWFGVIRCVLTNHLMWYVTNPFTHFTWKFLIKKSWKVVQLFQTSVECIQIIYSQNVWCNGALI